MTISNLVLDELLKGWQPPAAGRKAFLISGQAP